MILAAAAEQHMTWPDIVELGLFFAFVAVCLYIVARWM